MQKLGNPWHLSHDSNPTESKYRHQLGGRVNNSNSCLDGSIGNT